MKALSQSADEDPSPGEAFLAALADPGRPPLPHRTALVVAHPDDEAIGCGALLRRFADLTIFHITDGAPKNGVDAAALGFAGPAEYAATRRAELEAAMALAGIPPERLIWLGWSDQEASLNLPALARDLAGRLSGTEVVLTHAYEGGHPDHDAAAFAVHAACALIAPSGPAPLIIEMPLYRAGADGRLVQGFVSSPACPEAEVPLNGDEQQLKQAMYAAHASQKDVLLQFRTDVEQFRQAPDHDFAALPNDGDLYYERFGWGMTGARWLQLAAAARARLGLRAVA